MARRRTLTKPVKAVSPLRGLDVFRGRMAAPGGSKKGQAHGAVKTATARTTRFRIRPVKHSVALARA